MLSRLSPSSVRSSRGVLSVSSRAAHSRVFADEQPRLSRAEDKKLLEVDGLLLIGGDVLLHYDARVGEPKQKQVIVVTDLRKLEAFVANIRNGREGGTATTSGIGRCSVCASDSPFLIADSVDELLCNHRNLHDQLRVGPPEIFLDISISEVMAALLHDLLSDCESRQLHVTVPTFYPWAARSHLAQALALTGVTAVSKISTSAAALGAAFLQTHEAQDILINNDGQAYVLLVEIGSDSFCATVMSVEAVISNLPLSRSETDDAADAEAEAGPEAEYDAVTETETETTEGSTSPSASSSSRDSSVSAKGKRGNRGKRTEHGVLGVGVNLEVDLELAKRKMAAARALLLRKMHLSCISSCPLVRLEASSHRVGKGLRSEPDELRRVAEECVRSVIAKSPCLTRTANHHLLLWIDGETGEEVERAEKGVREIVQAVLTASSFSVGKCDGKASMPCLRLPGRAVEIGGAVLSEAKTRAFESPCRSIGLRVCEETSPGYLSEVVWLPLRSLDCTIDVKALDERPGCVGVCMRGTGKMVGTVKIPDYTVNRNLELLVVEDRSDGTDDDSIGVLARIPWASTDFDAEQSRREEDVRPDVELCLNSAGGLLSLRVEFTAPLSDDEEEEEDEEERREEEEDKSLSAGPGHLELALKAMLLVLALLLVALLLRPKQKGKAQEECRLVAARGCCQLQQQQWYWQ